MVTETTADLQMDQIHGAWLKGTSIALRNTASPEIAAAINAYLTAMNYRSIATETIQQLTFWTHRNVVVGGDHNNPFVMTPSEQIAYLSTAYEAMQADLKAGLSQDYKNRCQAVLDLVTARNRAKRWRA